MPIHPAAPVGLDEYVEGFRQSVQAVVDLGRSCSDEDFARDTSCPGWTVQDHIAHLAAVESFLEGADNPDVELPVRDHVRHEFGEWMERGVQARRGLPGTAVVDELEVLLHNRLASLAEPDLTPETMVRAPLGTTRTLRSLLRLRLNDVWVHEQDLREALGRPGDLDSPGAAAWVSAIVAFFPAMVASRVTGLPDGQVVILESTGPVTARVGVRLRANPDPDAPADEAVIGEPLFTGVEPGEAAATAGWPGSTAPVPDADIEPVTIAMSTDALTRRAAGRRSTADTAYRVIGDEAVARRVLDALVMTP